MSPGIPEQEEAVGLRGGGGGCLPSGLRAPWVPSRVPSLSYLAAGCWLRSRLQSGAGSTAVSSSRLDVASRCEDRWP